MPFIEWNEKYSVHIEEIDSQHKKIFSIINRLHSALKARKGKKVIGNLLDELVDYTYYHFATEENISVSAATLILMFTNLNMI